MVQNGGLVIKDLFCPLLFCKWIQRKKRSKMIADNPTRTCIVTREGHPKEVLLRFVVAPGGKLVADLSGKLPGRGMYVTCSKLLVAEAIAKRAFSRAAK